MVIDWSEKSEVRHGEWSELSSGEIDHKTRGARVKERDVIESIRLSADQSSEINEITVVFCWFRAIVGKFL